MGPIAGTITEYGYDPFDDEDRLDLDHYGEREWTYVEDNGQLRLFVDPVALARDVEDDELPSVEGRHRLAPKLREAIWKGTADNIETEGVRNPIVLSFGRPEGIFGMALGKAEGDETLTVGNGHHRLAVAADLGFDLIPVVYSDGYTFASVDGDDDRARGVRTWDAHPR